MCRLVTANVRSFRPEIALSAILEVVTVPLATFDVVIALAMMSPFWMLFVSVSFEYGMPAPAAMSASTIVPSRIFAEVIALLATVGFGYVPLRSPPAAPLGLVGAGAVHTTFAPS